MSMSVFTASVEVVPECNVSSDSVDAEQMKQLCDTNHPVGWSAVKLPQTTSVLQTAGRRETLWWSRCCFTAVSLHHRQPSLHVSVLQFYVQAIRIKIGSVLVQKPLERFPSDGRQDGVDEVEESRHVREDLKRQREHQWILDGDDGTGGRSGGHQSPHGSSSEDHKHLQDNPE